MDAKKQAFLILALISAGLVALAVLVLALMFAQYLLIAGEITGGVIFLRFGALPIAEKLIDLNGKVQRQRLERQEMLLRIEPDKGGAFAQYFDARERQAIYYPTAPRALPAPRNRREVEGSLAPEQEQEEEQEQPDQPAEIYYLSDMIARGLNMAGEESLLGLTLEGEAVWGKLFDIDRNFYNSVFVAGESGYGKSTLGVLNSGYTVANGGGLLLIDPDAELDESLYNRLGALRRFLLCEVATTPQEAKRVLQVARAELEKPSAYPVLFMVDEYSAIARHLGSKTGAWREVAPELIELVEDYASRGRKRQRRAIVFGQYTQASRSGGTEARDGSMTHALFRLKKPQARLVVEKEEIQEVTSLKAGQIFIIPARSSQSSFTMQLLYPDDQAIEQIVSSRLAQEQPDPRANIRALSPAGQDRRARVLNLREAGHKQDAIIEMVWGCKKGGSERYRSALQEYRAIVSQTDEIEEVYGG